jgi:hypothetical protein
LPHMSPDLLCMQLCEQGNTEKAQKCLTPINI